MCNGWIKLHRKILDWEWFSCPSTFHLFIYLLLIASTEDKKWKGLVVKRGQLIASVASICEGTHLTTQQVRTSLNRLKSTNEITIETTNKYSLITICKYDSYQQNEPQVQQAKQQADQQTNNKQITNKQQHLKNNKNIRKKEDKEDIFTNVHISEKDATKVAPIKTIDERKSEFLESLKQYVPIYGARMIQEFYDYWSESSENARKFRKEKQTTWDTAKRLARWAKNQKSYGTNNGNGRTSTREQRDAEWNAYAMHRLYQSNDESEEIPAALRDS